MSRIALGISDFREFHEGKFDYVDKTLLIRDIINDPSKVLLLPRPRRFGKTLNLSMLRYFLAKDAVDTWPLFQELAIAKAGDSYRTHHQRYPTIFLSFKDLKASSWKEMRRDAANLIARLYEEHETLLPGLSSHASATFSAILNKTASMSDLQDSLLLLSTYLARRHGQKVLILLDEYDTPLHAAHHEGYYGKALPFFRTLLSAVLKDNVYLHKGILTGVLRVAKDSIFTGLNNLDVCTLVQRRYATAFGFTEPEVGTLLERAGMTDHLEEIQRWYNGYLFGEEVIYNPWSVLSYIKNRPRYPVPYWSHTSSNDLIRELLLDRGMGLSSDMEQLIRGGSVLKPLYEQVALRELQNQTELIWSFLLMSGYLKLLRQELRRQTLYGEMAIPNLEVQTIYEGIFADWWRSGLGGEESRQALVQSLLFGDVATCQRLLAGWLLRNASMWDVAGYTPPERFYHGFLLGLLVSLGEGYEVESNRESGYGRSDVLLCPKKAGQPGAVLELKVRRPEEEIDKALDAALRQIKERRYAEALAARGATPVQEMAILFDGKEVHCRIPT